MKTINDMRIASGQFTSNDPLVSFFYNLLRDGCPPSIIEESLKQMNSNPCFYTNGWLGQYAEYIAKRLREIDAEYIVKPLKANG